MIVDRYTGEVLYPSMQSDTDTIARLRGYIDLLADVTNTVLNGQPATTMEGRAATLEGIEEVIRAKIEAETALAGLLGGPTGTTFTRAGIGCGFQATGEVDCPSCGRIHTENEVLSMWVGHSSVNWCPCGCIWREHTNDSFDILTTDTWADMDCRQGLKQQYMDNNVRYLLRTTETSLNAPDSNGNPVTLCYSPDDGCWIVDRETDHEMFTSFDEAWEDYWNE